MLGSSSDAFGVAIASQTLVSGVLVKLCQKGMLSPEDAADILNDSLTILETVAPDDQAIRVARQIIERITL